MTPGARLRRRVDRALYWLLFRAERALFPAPLTPPRAPRRVLVVASHRVGDLVVLGPTLSYLHARLPGAEIDVAAADANASLLAGDPRLRAVVRREPTRLGWWRAVRALRRRRYDVVLSTRVLDHLSEALFAALVAPHGVRASAWRPRRYMGFFTCRVRVPRRHGHVVDRLLYLARTALGDATEGPDGAALRVPPAALPADEEAGARARQFADGVCGGRPFVAFTAWGSDPKRCFGVEIAAEIAEGIAAAHPGLVVAVTPAPAAVGEADAIARLAVERLARRSDRGEGPEPRVVVAPASADLRDLVALIRRAAAVVTPDTANMHVAAAVGTPYLAVYSAYTAVELWGAWGGPRRVVYAADRRGVREIPVGWVVEGFEELTRG